jgi:predicted dehydrogenase
METFKWGLIGPGAIAGNFAGAVKAIPDAEILAVASRNMERASGFAQKHGIKKAYDSYSKLLEDKDIDGIYVSLVNPFHYDIVKASLNAGKPVLCEKPLALNFTQAEDLVTLSEKKGVFLMEAMWTRFNPVYKYVDEWIKNDRIGDLVTIQASFGFDVPWADDDRHVDPKLGGGALLDAGIYNILFVIKYLGANPVSVKSAVSRYHTGIDGRESIILEFEGGKQAVLHSAVNLDMPNDAYLFGTKGHIYLPYYWRGIKAILRNPQPGPFLPYDEEEANISFQGNGYEYEVMEAMRCIRDRKFESETMPHKDTLGAAKIMTDLRRGWGVKYEGFFGE